jgi:septal ring factor EnvC (AmiA/AmiB activator)
VSSVATVGILDRLGRTIKSNINSLIDKAEDPAKVIAQTIEDMQEELKKARADLVSSVATVKQLEKKYKDQVEEGATWEKRAMLALEHGDDELAREALKRKKKSEGDAADTDRTREAQQAYVNELKATIDQLDRKVEELKARKNTMASRWATPARPRATPRRGGPTRAPSAACATCRIASTPWRPRWRPRTCSSTRRRPTSRSASASWSAARPPTPSTTSSPP